ncbi:MAG TPA: hypothetical protein VG870_06485 [Chitinophagaceae bacterium]|nr:hypothetical protein [Chitinophagaceae bacterium]
MKKQIAVILAAAACQFALAQTGQFDYGYSSHTQALTSTDKALLSISNQGLMPADFKNVYSDIKGSAFYSTDWMTANLYNQRGNVYRNMKAMFDLYKNRLFLNVRDTVYNTGPAIVRFDLLPNGMADTTHKLTFSNQFTLPDPAAGKYVQVISQGKLSFVKYVSREVVEEFSGMNSGKEKVFYDKTYYYVIASTGQPLDVPKLNKKNLQKALSDKWNEIDKFVSQDRDLSYGREEDWKKIIDYYNSLP